MQNLGVCRHPAKACYASQFSLYIAHWNFSSKESHLSFTHAYQWHILSSDMKAKLMQDRFCFFQGTYQAFQSRGCRGSWGCLFQMRDYARHINTGPPDFQIFLRPCSYIMRDRLCVFHSTFVFWKKIIDFLNVWFWRFLNLFFFKSICSATATVCDKFKSRWLSVLG